MVGAEGHLGDHNAEGAHPQKPSRHHSCPELAHYTWLQDTRVAEWEADSHITVQGHSHEHPRLHGGKCMDEEQLDETGMVFNLMSMKPEYSQHFRLGGRGEDQVSDSQHGQKKVHGLMQGVVSSDYMKDGDIAHDSHNVHGTEWKGNPKLGILKSWDAKQDEGHRMRRAVPRSQHHEMFNLFSIYLLPAGDTRTILFIIFWKEQLNHRHLGLMIT